MGLRAIAGVSRGVARNVICVTRVLSTESQGVSRAFQGGFRRYQ